MVVTTGGSPRLTVDGRGGVDDREDYPWSRSRRSTTGTCVRIKTVTEVNRRWLSLPPGIILIRHHQLEPVPWIGETRSKRSTHLVSSMTVERIPYFTLVSTFDGLCRRLCIIHVCHPHRSRYEPKERQTQLSGVRETYDLTLCPVVCLNVHNWDLFNHGNSHYVV